MEHSNEECPLTCEGSESMVVVDIKEAIPSPPTNDLLKVSTFDWPSALELRGWTEVPEDLFAHVEVANDSGVREGMVVEILLDSAQDLYWLARVEQTFGPMLKLSLVGHDPQHKTFVWRDLYKDKLYPLGWCQMNKVVLTAPQEIQRTCPNWQTVAIQYLEDITIDTISMHFIDGNGVTNLDRIKDGMMLEVQSSVHPYKFWPAKVLNNHGGLLTLQHVGASSKWLEFYLSERLVPFKRGQLEGNGYQRPLDVDESFSIDDLLQSDTVKVIPEELFPTPPEIPKNQFDAQSLLEFIPPNSTCIERAIIEQKFEDKFFVVSCFSNPERKYLCHKNTPSIFPFGWSNGWSKIPCRQSEQEKRKPHCPRRNFASKVDAKEVGFQVGQTLEILIDDDIRVGKIADIRDNILAIEEVVDHTDPRLILVPATAQTIFPVGWACLNGGNLSIPTSLNPKPLLNDQEDQIKSSKSSSVTKESSQECPEESKAPTIPPQTPIPNSIDSESSWCQPIFFNYRCYSSMFLSRARLASLPKSIGPGPVRLVLSEVLSRIIGSSHKSGSVLKRLECQTEMPRIGFEKFTIKGKSRVHLLKADIEIPTKANLVEEFCRSVCQKLGACKNLLSLTRSDDCPDNCVSRPKAELKPDYEPKARRGRKRQLEVPEDNPEPEGGSGTSSETDESATPNMSRSASPEGNEDNGMSGKPGKGRKKEWEAILPKSEIRTRGAKIPNYKLHLKIRPSKKEQQVIESQCLRKSFGFEAFNANQKMSDQSQDRSDYYLIENQEDRPPPIREIVLHSNPEHWTPEDTAKFLLSTKDCGHIASFMMSDEVDGVAFMLLNYPTIQDFWSFSVKTAINLCRHIESVRWAHLRQFRSS